MARVSLLPPRATCPPSNQRTEEPTMRILRQAIAFAGIFVVPRTGGDRRRAAPSRPADRRGGGPLHRCDALREETCEPAPPADDATLLRRLTLDLAGRIPTAAESRAFPSRTDPEKTVRLVDRLMGSPGYVRHQAAELDAMLMGGDPRQPARLPGPGRRREPTVGPDLPRADAPRPGRQGRQGGRRVPRDAGSRTPTGSPPRSARHSSGSTSVVPSATTTRWSTTGSRTTSTA